MADNDKKRYYWLKLQKDFFKRHDIRIIESMPNGKDYILFYLKLLCESTSHEGNLRFSDTIPYSEEMLSTITNTNIDIVRSAIKVFVELHMIDILDNGTYFMNEVLNMIGSETGKARRMRDYRDRTSALATSLPQCSLEIELEKEIDIEKEYITAQSDLKNHSMPPVIELILKDGSSHQVFQNDIDELSKLYQSVDVIAELRKMKGWLNANPTKRKTKAGIKRFINGWLTKEQSKHQQQPKTDSYNITKFDV